MRVGRQVSALAFLRLGWSRSPPPSPEICRQHSWLGAGGAAGSSSALPSWNVVELRVFLTAGGSMAGCVARAEFLRPPATEVFRFMATAVPSAAAVVAAAAAAEHPGSSRPFRPPHSGGSGSPGGEAGGSRARFPKRRPRPFPTCRRRRRCCSRSPPLLPPHSIALPFASHWIRSVWRHKHPDFGHGDVI